MAKQQADSEAADDIIKDLEDDIKAEDVEDESSDDSSQDDDTDGDDDKATDEETDDDSSDEDSKDDSEEEDSDQPEFKKRFTQFKGDNLEDYNKNLEKAYGESYNELARLKEAQESTKAQLDGIAAAIAKDPELAEKLEDVLDGGQAVTPPAPQKSPVAMAAEQEVIDKWKKDYDSFLEVHPEVESDPTIADALDKAVTVVADTIRTTEGRQIGMGEALDKAWIILYGSDDKEDKIRMAAKDAASTSKTNSGNKKPSKGPEFTDKQLLIAKRLGLTEKELREQLKK